MLYIVYKCKQQEYNITMKQTKKKEKLKVTSTKFSPNTKVEIIYVEICKNCRTPEY